MGLTLLSESLLSLSQRWRFNRRALGLKNHLFIDYSRASPASLGHSLKREVETSVEEAEATPAAVGSYPLLLGKRALRESRKAKQQ